MRVNNTLVEHMVGVVSALDVRFLIGVFALLEVIEKSIIGHDMIGIKGAPNSFDLLIHY